MPTRLEVFLQSLISEKWVYMIQGIMVRPRVPPLCSQYLAKLFNRQQNNQLASMVLRGAQVAAEMNGHVLKYSQYFGHLL